MVARSKLHSSSWAYVRAYRYWCEYLEGKPSITLFFHIFHCHSGTLAQLRGQKLVYLVSTIRVFEDIPGLFPFVDRFFLVTPHHPLAHKTICRAEPEVGGKCKPLFPYYWSEACPYGE